jgi:ABC-type nickel/cobalt efflux system permease component RcnA
MPGLDQHIADLGSRGGLLVALVAAVVLGLRHATDPDHLTAVSMLVLSERRAAGRRAGALGLCWGLGHATTLMAFGLPVVVAGGLLPEPARRAAELAVGLLVAALALRLLVRWRRGYLHVHVHTHGGRVHAHPHVHEERTSGPHPGAHTHAHSDDLGRTRLAAFGVGLVHGAGGSAGAGALLVGAMDRGPDAVLALALFAAATALSMAAFCLVFGTAITRGPLLARVSRAVPALGAAGLVFGLWYAFAALGTGPGLL